MKVYYDPSFLIALYLIEPLSPGAQKMWNNCQFRGSRPRRGVAGYCREVPEVPAPQALVPVVPAVPMQAERYDCHAFK